MKEKDLAEKQLEVYEDVYADIVNVLLFQGDKELWEKELETADSQSVYIGASKLHGQERQNIGKMTLSVWLLLELKIKQQSIKVCLCEFWDMMEQHIEHSFWIKSRKPIIR